MENPSVTATGYVDSIDHGVARVLIGRDESEWFFPMPALPEGVQAGDDILFLNQGERYTSLGFARVNMRSVDRSIEDRLHRPLAERRTAFAP